MRVAINRDKNVNGEDGPSDGYQGSRHRYRKMKPPNALEPCLLHHVYLLTLFIAEAPLPEAGGWCQLTVVAITRMWIQAVMGRKSDATPTTDGTRETEPHSKTVFDICA